MKNLSRAGAIALATLVPTNTIAAKDKIDINTATFYEVENSARGTDEDNIRFVLDEIKRNGPCTSIEELKARLEQIKRAARSQSEQKRLTNLLDDLECIDKQNEAELSSIRDSIHSRTIQITPETFDQLTNFYTELPKRLSQARESLGKKPQKDEFETSVQHQRRVDAWKHQVDLAEAPIIYAEIDATTWDLTAPVELMKYDADDGCFSHARIRIEFDVSRDVMKRIDGAGDLRYITDISVIGSETIKNLNFQSIIQRDPQGMLSWMLHGEAHPICMPPEQAREFSQKAITAHILMNKDHESGKWAAGGDFLTEDGQPIPVTKE